MTVVIMRKWVTMVMTRKWVIMVSTQAKEKKPKRELEGWT